MRIRQIGGAPGPEPVEPDAVVAVNADVYSNTSGELFTDVTLETPYTATIGEATAQVEATETVTIGGETFTKFTAGEKDCVDEDGKGVVADSEGVIYLVNDGVPESTTYSVLPGQEPVDDDSDSDSDVDTDSDSDSDSDSDTDTDTDSDTDTDADTQE